MSEHEHVTVLKEMFPDYPEDLIISVLESMNFDFQASLEGLLTLQSDDPGVKPAPSLASGFLEADDKEDELVGPDLEAETAKAELADEIAMQKQLEQIIRESAEETKQKEPKKKFSEKFKEKFKHMFGKKKEKQETKAKQTEPEVRIPNADSRKSVPRREEPEAIDEDEEIISFQTAEDPSNCRGARYTQLPSAEDIELMPTKKP